MHRKVTVLRVCCVSIIIILALVNPLSKYWIILSFELQLYRIVDFPFYEFHPNLTSIEQNCIVYPFYDNKITVYDCRKTKNGVNDTPNIGIASFHLYSETQKHLSTSHLTRYETMVLSNHVGYAIKHNCVYFDVNTLLFNDTQTTKYFDDNIPKANAPYKAQKPFIVHSVLNSEEFGHSIDYLLWIDFDAIFFNCSTSILSILDHSKRLYSNQTKYNSMDIIFARDYFSISNSGVILYKNTKWTKQLLLKQMFVFENAQILRFADIYLNVRKLVDQNVFNALVLGFDPPLNDKEWLHNFGYKEFKFALLFEQSLHSQIEHWYSMERCLVDEKQYVDIHDNYIGLNIRNHSAMIPQLYINLLMTEWVYSHYFKYHTLQDDPFIVHFAASMGKPYLKSPRFKKLRCSCS